MILQHITSAKGNGSGEHRCIHGIVVQFRELFIPLLGLGCKGDTVQTGSILGKELETLAEEQNRKD